MPGAVLKDVTPTGQTVEDSFRNIGYKIFVGTSADVEQNAVTGQWAGTAGCTNFPVVGTTLYKSGATGVILAMTCDQVRVQKHPGDLPEGMIRVIARYVAPKSVTF